MGFWVQENSSLEDDNRITNILVIVQSKMYKWSKNNISIISLSIKGISDCLSTIKLNVAGCAALSREWTFLFSKLNKHRVFTQAPSKVYVYIILITNGMIFSLILNLKNKIVCKTLLLFWPLPWRDFICYRLISKRRKTFLWEKDCKNNGDFFVWWLPATHDSIMP
jgi:hypothetical protein